MKKPTKLELTESAVIFFAIMGLAYLACLLSATFCLADLLMNPPRG